MRKISNHENKGSEAVSVTIAVCTYQRLSVFDTLKSFESLTGLNKYDVGVIVIDNDETDAIKSSIESFSESYSLKLHYIHAPKKNISIARNMAINSVVSDWLLFIDDDEVAEVHWLENIMEDRQNSDVVIGRCEAVYEPHLPKWLSRCDFHSNKLAGKPENAYTSNALIKTSFIRKNNLQFRLELGKTGGEDTMFFREIYELGGSFKYSPQAVVYEPVPDSRATMTWVKTRKFRAGQVHGLICQEFDSRAYKYLLLTAACKSVFSAFMSLITIPGSDKSRFWIARSYLHAGAVNYKTKKTIFEEYNQ